MHNGPAVEQVFCVGRLAPGMSPPIPTYNRVPAAQALSFSTTTPSLAAPSREPLVHRRPLRGTILALVRGSSAAFLS